MMCANILNVRNEGRSPVITHLVNSSHTGQVPTPGINVDVPSVGISSSILAFFSTQLSKDIALLLNDIFLNICRLKM